MTLRVAEGNNIAVHHLVVCGLSGDSYTATEWNADSHAAKMQAAC